MRKLIHTAVLAMTMMAATAAHTPEAKAANTACWYFAQQMCEGTLDPNGNYYYPGGPGWVSCVEDMMQYIPDCEGSPGPPPRNPGSK